MKKIKVRVEYYDLEWRKNKLLLNKKKLQKEKMDCSSISVIGNGTRLSFEQNWGSTNLDGRQIKKLVIENCI